MHDFLNVQVIAPNLKRRLSGVTATIARLVPVQTDMIDIAATGPGLPTDIAHMSLTQVALLPRKPLRVWHARRNTEMLLGLALRHVLRKNLKLLFTSASQRKHSGYTKWLINKMDAIVATSSKTKTYLEREATVVMHGINLETFTPPADKSALRANLGLPDGCLVGCYGRIRKQKGTDAFIETMISVCQASDDVTGIILGRATGEHQAFLDEQKQRIADAGLSERILILPEVAVDQIADWYRVLDLYVAPQRWEGFGLTPIEAMACAVPVVATDVGAFAEIITDPAIGTVVSPDDIPALTHATADILENRVALAEAGSLARKHVEVHFSLEREAKQLVSIYQDLLAAQ